jgi:hypothetical protein
MTKGLSDQIIISAEMDYIMRIRLGGVIDLTAAEAKYHLVCLSAFKRSTKKEQNLENKDIAMTWLCSELRQASNKGYVLELPAVWDRYKTLADDTSTIIPPSYLSRRGTFKDKLQ